jgi:hypothetical protein
MKSTLRYVRDHQHRRYNRIPDDKTVRPSSISGAILTSIHKLRSGIFSDIRSTNIDTRKVEDTTNVSVGFS